MDAAPAEHPQIGNYKAPPPSGQMSAPPPHGHYGGPPGHFHQHQHQGGPPMHGQHHYHSHSHGHMHQHQHQQHHPSHLHGHSSHLYHQHSAHSMPGQRDLDTLGSGAHAHSIPQISSPNTQIFNHPNETRVPLSPNTERRQGESHALIARLDDFVKQREMDQAQLIFEQIVQTRADSYCHPEVSRRLPDIYLNFAKSSLGKHCHVTPLDLIHSLRRSRQIPDKDFYESMMRILAHRQYFEYAIRVFEEMDKDNIKAEPVTFSCLVNFAVEMNDGVRAKIFFDALCKRQTPSIRAYMQMLRMQSKLKDADEAFRLLKDMEARGVGVDRLAINTALGACVNGNDLEKARQLMSFAKRYHGDRLDIITFNTLLKGPSTILIFSFGLGYVAISTGTARLLALIMKRDEKVEEYFIGDVDSDSVDLEQYEELWLPVDWLTQLKNAMQEAWNWVVGHVSGAREYCFGIPTLGQ
eukprot:gene302-922_t